MRINQFLARATGISRRQADEIIKTGRVTIDGRPAAVGDIVTSNSTVQLDNCEITPTPLKTVLFNKPVGYICSRNGQGSKTIYDILPAELESLKTIGRLDKDSSGLLVLTNDGTLAQALSHPSKQKQKTYLVKLNKRLLDTDRDCLAKGVMLEDGISKLQLQKSGEQWKVTITEGRNRQIRRTFAALKYKVTALHRTEFGDFSLGDLMPGQFATVSDRQLTER